MVCTAATHVSLPISMHPLSARPACLLSEEGCWLKRVFICFLSARVVPLDSCLYLVLKRSHLPTSLFLWDVGRMRAHICKNSTMFLYPSPLHTHTRTHTPPSTHTHTSAAFYDLRSKWDWSFVVLTRAELSFCDAKAKNQWEHYTNRPVKQRWGSVPLSSFASTPSCPKGQRRAASQYNPCPLCFNKTQVSVSSPQSKAINYDLAARRMLLK